ncbi:hypothetical protein [endosymbiont GvMRE of Glomus versiforme]|uniref:hypothetical protein n=1 Tax=endosymbiont GvMRE of Glomus versiforme TaxID=2039283 RepID=UPI001558BE72|nr:hypothetical protein [endosymbiont GvMRE of Glomus versiforme]
MNQYGICNFLNLVLFTEFTPFGWLQKNWSRIWIVWLYLITIFFIWITNLKLEMPVEINTLYNQNNKLLKNSEFKLGFRLNFSLIPLIYLSTFIRHVYTFFLMRGRTDWTSLGSIFSNLEKANKDKIILNEKHRRGKKGFWYCFFSLNEDKWIFNWKNLEKLLSRNKWMIVGAIIFLVLFRWLVIWFQARKISPWKTKEISKDLQKRGIYINYISPGNSTRQLLKKIVNKIIIFWNFSILILNIIFDNIFAYAGKNAEKLNFMSWFGGVNIGVELIRQIRTKFEYIKNS